MPVVIEVTSALIVRGLPEKMVEHLKKTLTISNPQYYKLMRATGNRARAFYGTPKTFSYFKEKDGTLIIPRGMRDPLIDFLKTMKVEYIEQTTSLISIPL